MKPEEQAETILWDWLTTDGEYVKEIYFNRKKDGLNCKTFNVRGNRKIPDIIINTNHNGCNKYIVVEVKSSNKSSNILDAKKIIDYYCLYVKGDTKYYIDNEEIKISDFLVATDKSKDGYLFSDEKIIDSLKEIEKKSKHKAVNLGIVPRYEGSKTSGFVRGSLWKWFEDIRNEFKIKCGLGILIADINCFNIPKMQINSFEYNNKKNKNQWGQRWRKL